MSSAKIAQLFLAWGIKFRHPVNYTGYLLSQVILLVDELEVHHSSWKVNVVSISEHCQHVVVYSRYFPSLYRQCTAAMYIQ